MGCTFCDEKGQVNLCEKCDEFEFEKRAITSLSDGKSHPQMASSGVRPAYGSNAHSIQQRRIRNMNIKKGNQPNPHKRSITPGTVGPRAGARARVVALPP